MPGLAAMRPDDPCGAPKAGAQARGVGWPWSEERIRRELDAFLPGHDVWPSSPQVRAAGRRELQAIAARGGPALWAEEYGLPSGWQGAGAAHPAGSDPVGRG